MSTACGGAQLILLVDVTVPLGIPPGALSDVDACRAEVYSQASGGRSLRGGLSSAKFL